MPKKLTERRLRFSFRAQLWEEVLQWFAEQADLSLVMDRPPPGSFNYVDDKEYSPIEGIDLLNGVLMTKRFTLIRNERMLMVIDLSEGIPQGIVPVVTLDDLKERGNFELVSMRFLLGRRDVAAVTQEITALLGPNGNAVSLPATKQLLVTDTAGIMKAIGAVIESIPEPPAPKEKPKPAEPAKPEKPELQVHEIKTADPPTVIEVLKQFFASDNFVLDEPNRRFTVNTAPSRHEAIKKVLEQIDVDSPAGKAWTLETYPVEIGPPTGEPRDRRSRSRGGRRFFRSSSGEDDPAAPLIELLKNAVPQAQITYDGAGRQLVVWATSEEHTKLKATLDKILGDSLLERTPHVEAYPLEKADPASTLTMFQTLLPDAQISLDTKSRILVALAIPADHDAISTTLEQMQKAESGEHAPMLKVYPVAMDMTTAITAALTSLVPEAQVTVDTENKRLVAIATKAQHEAIQATIDELSASGADRNNMLVVYPVKSAEPASVLELLENLYPRLTIVLDTKGNRLMVWARAEEHASIKSTLEQLTSASAAEGERHFETYTIHGIAGRSAESLSVFMPKLQELAPGAAMTHDTTTGKLLVWGTDAEHARIAGALAKMGQGDTPETTPVIQRYSFTKADPTSTMTLLQSLVPEAQLSIEAKTSDLIAVAVPADHAKIKAILEQLQPAEAGPDAPVLKFHPVKEELPADVMTLLATKVPRAEITADTKNKRLMVIASPADHEVIAATIAQVEEGGPTAPELRFIPLEEELPASVMSLLTTKAPGATIMPDPANKRLMVVASPADQEVIARLVQQATAAGPTAPKMQFISLEEKLPSSVLTVIQTLVPSATVTVDNDGRTLMVVASPTDFEKVKETISQAMESLGPEEENSLVVYPVTPALRARAEAVLASITAELPGIQILPDTDQGAISIWAKPSQHKVIAGVFEQLKQEIPAKDKYTLVAYTMKSADAQSVMDMLGQLFPNTQIVIEAKTNRLLVWTRPDEHESIRAALDQIELSGAPDELRRFKAFSIKGAVGLNPTSQAAAAAAIVEQLQTLVPNAKLTMDAKAGKLLAFGTPSELEIIGMAVAELGHGEVSPDGAAKLELYDLTKAEPTSTMTLLQGLVPGAEITLDATGKRLMVFATPEDHKAVQETLDMLQTDAPGPDDPQIFFYLMDEAPPTTLVTGLQSLVPEAQVTYDEEGKTLMVVAKPADQKVIEQAVKEMGAKLPEKEKNTLIVYPATPDQRKRFEATLEVIKTDMPDIQIVADEDGANVSVWAKPSEHEIIGEVLQQLRSDISGEGRRSFEVYPIQGAVGYESNRSGSIQNSIVLLTGLQEIVPSAKLMIEADGRKLIAWATAAEHEMIAEAVGKLDAAAKEKLSRLEAYTVKGTLVRDIYGRRVQNTDLINGLQTLAPDARMAIDAESGKLVVWGTPEDHDIISAAVEKLSSGDSDESRPTLVVYQLTTANPTTLLTALQQLVPQAQLSVDTQTGSIVALAVPSDQEVIRATLEKLQPAAEGPSRRELLMYPFTEPPPASVVTGIQAMIPNAQVSMDADGKHLMVVATPAEHALVKESIDKLEQAAAMKEKPYFEAYTIRGIGGPAGTSRYSSVSTLMSSLSPLVPDARLSVDYATGKLIAWATAKDHEKLKGAIAKLVGDDSPENTPVVEIHAITKADPTSTMTLLQSMVPEAQLSIETPTGNLIALAVPADQEIIRKTLEQLQPAEPGPNTPEIVLYPFTERPPSSVVTGLQTLAPKAKITVDPDGKHLMIVATPADHARIKESIDKLEQADSMKDKPYFEAYTLAGIGGPPGYTQYMIVSALLPSLSPMVPDARLTVDSQTGKLIAWATTKDHEKLKAAIAKLAGDGSPENTRVVEIHALTKADPTSTMTLLQSMVPEAQLSIEPQTNNLIALAVPADQEIIRKTLEQLQPAEPGPNTPEIVLYPFTERPPSSVVTGLQTLAPKAQITVDPDGKHLMVVATPADHARIKASIDKLEQADSMKDKPYFEAYTLTGIGGPPGYPQYAIVSALLPTLSPMVPDARLMVDTQTGKLIAWATAKDHEKLKGAIAKLAGDGSPENTRVVEIHALTKADPTSTMTLLQSMVPEAQLSIETPTGNLIALAVPADQEIIRKTLEQLQPAEPGPNTPEIRFYQLSKPAPPTLIPGLQALAPKAQLTLGPKGERLMVVATVADHAVVKANLEKIDAAASMEEQNTLAVYAVTPAERRRFNTLLPTIMTDLPGIQVITDAEPGELSVWARPSQHEAVGKILEELKREVPPEQKYKLVGYSVKSSDVNSVMTVLASLFPDTQFTADPRGRRILAYSTPAQHAEIAAAMEEMEGDASGTGEEKFVSHPVPAAISSTVFTVLRGLLPGVTMYQDASTGSIIAWGRDLDHELIAKTIEQLHVEPDSKFKPYLMVYPPGDSDVMALYTLLSRLVPQATIVPDTTNRTLSVFAMAKDHETVQSAINSASATAAGTGERTVETYSLENQTAASATVLLRSIVPQGQYSVGVDTHQLVVSAFAQDHRKIKKALDQLEASGPPETLPVLKTYQLKSTTASGASIGMQRIVPEAIFSIGTDPFELIAWARPADHEKIQRVVDELAKDPPAETVATFKVYGLDEITYTTAMSILRLSVPQAQISAGVDTHQLIAWARSDDHEHIQATLDQIDVKGPDDKIAKAKVYEVDTGDPTKDFYILNYLRTAVPTATFALAMDTVHLAVWARPADHEKIADLLEELIPPGSKSTLVTYSLTSITATEATGILRQIVPNIQLNTGANPHQLLVWATPKEHEKIEGLLEGIDKEGALEDEPATEIYSLEHITAATATQILTLTMPEVRFNTGSDPKQLIAIARPIDHEAVKAAIEKLDVESPYNQTATLKVYTLEPAYTGAGYYQMQLIQQMVPTATITQGRDYTQLVALASAEDHKRIEELIEELADDLPPEKAPKAVVYTLDEVTPSSATQILRLAVPNAQLSTSDDPSQLVAWAKPRDHEKIAEVLQQIDVKGAEDKAAKLVVYTLASSDYGRNSGAMTFLQRTITGGTFTMSSDYSQIIARARPKDHEQIAEILAEFDKEPPVEKAPVTEVYALDVITSTTAMQLLRSVVPDAEFTPGQETSQLIAYARPLDHVKIKQTLLKIDVEATDATTMVIYQLASSSSRRNYFTYIQFLQQEVPGAAYTLGSTDPSQLIVSARPKDHEKIAEIIQQLEKEAPPELKPALVAYSLQHVTAADAMRLLTGIVPEAELNAGGNDHQFIAWATPKDHEKLVKFIADLDKEEAAESKPTTVVYHLEKITAATAMQVLRVTLPAGNFSVGADPKQLIASVRPIDHQLVQSTVDLIDVESPFEKESTVVIYTLETTSRNGAFYQMQFMQTAVPEATFTLGSEIGQLVVRARPEDHKKIEELVEQLAKDLPLEKQPKAVVYTLEEITSGSAMQLLRQAVRDAEFSTTDDTGQLVVWATPKDHEKIATVLKQIDVESTGTTTVIYQLASSDSRRNYYTYIQFLRQEVSSAAYSLGATDPSQLIVSARPKDHKKILELIQELEKEASPELAPSLATYSLQHINASDAMRLLSDIVPEADLNTGANEYQFIAWATPRIHQKVAKFLADLDKEETADSKPITLVYDLENITATTAQQVLAVSLPEATLRQGSDPKQLIAVARPVDQALIKSTLVLIDVESPFEKDATVVIYTLETTSRSGSFYQRQFLLDAVPEASISSGSESNQLVIRARPQDHKKIEQLLVQLSKDLPLEKQPKAVVYALQEIGADDATEILREVARSAEFSTTKDGQLLAWAMPRDHEKIATVLKQIDVEAPEAAAARMLVYSLENLDATGATRLLQTVVPEAQFGVGANARQLIAWARPADHKKIKDTIEQMSKEESAETAPRFQVYTVEATGATDAIGVLQAAVPEAEFNVGTDSRQLIAFARPAEHEKIKAALDQLATRGPEESLPTIKVYSLETAGAQNAMRVLQQALPEAQFNIGDDASKLIAWAYPEDHAVIKAAVEEIEADSWLEGNREMSVYSVRREDVDALMQLLDPVLRQHAQFVTDDERESLIVWANKKYHEAIRKTIDEFIAKLPEPVEPEVVVYRFERSDPRSAYLALRSLVPEAEISLDPVSRNLVVSALPEDQKKIRATIAEIEREDAGGQAPQLKIHRIRTADPQNLLSVIRNLFIAERDVQLSLDADNDSLIAYAAPRHHDRIAELLAEVEKGALEDSSVRMQLHSLKNVDTYSSLSILRDALDKMGAKADLSTDYTRNALVAIARPEHQEKIAELLDELRGEERILEIFQLDYLELASAERAIRQLFSEESYQSAPQTEADYETQQLFIRATAEQLAEARRLLIQLGEVGLTSISEGGDSRLRVIQFKGDLQSIVEEIRRVWPQLRSNEMRIVTPADLVPQSEPKPEPKAKPAVPTEKPRAEAKPAEQPKAEAKPAPAAEKPKAEAKPEAKSAEKPKAEAKPQPEPAAKPAAPAKKPKAEPKPEVKAAATPKTEAKPAPAAEKPKPTPPAAATPQPEPAAKPEPKPAKPAATQPAEKAEDKKAEEQPEAAKGAAGPEGQSGSSGAAGPKDPDAKAKSTPGAPVTMMVGEDSLTIASDDLDALNELESLLRTLSQRSGSAFSGRNYSVFQLNNTSAAAVSQTLQSMFRDKMSTSTSNRTNGRTGSRYGYGYGYGSRPTPLVIVPDERLNTIFVQGSRSDRTLIESLIQMLDTDEVPETSAARKPKMIPIQNARASEVEQTIRDMFASQLASGSSTTGGAAFAPRLAVDATTNTLIVTAPAPLMDDITELAESLDKKAGDNPAERLKIIRLKKANATRVEDALNSIMRGGGSYRGNSRRR